MYVMRAEKACTVLRPPTVTTSRVCPPAEESPAELVANRVEEDPQVESHLELVTETEAPAELPVEEPLGNAAEMLENLHVWDFFAV